VIKFLQIRDKTLIYIHDFLCVVAIKQKVMTTDFNNMPMQIDRVLNELQAIKILIAKIQKPEEIPKRLTFEKALEFLKTQSFEMSKSQLYKLCAARKIPHSHFGNRLVFDTNELLRWCEQSLIYKKVKNHGNK